MENPGAASMDCIGPMAHHRAYISFLATSEGDNMDISFSSGSSAYIDVQMANSVYNNYWSHTVIYFIFPLHLAQWSNSNSLLYSSGGQATFLLCFNTEWKLFRWMRRVIYNVREFLVPHFFYYLSVRYYEGHWICAWASYCYSRTWVGQALHTTSTTPFIRMWMFKYKM